MNLRKRKAEDNPNDELPEGLKKPKRMRLEVCEGLQLVDLPLLPMNMIISKLNPHHTGLLRFVSKKLKMAHFNYMLHYYKTILWAHTHYQGSSSSENSDEFFLWQVTPFWDILICNLY